MDATEVSKSEVETLIEELELDEKEQESFLNFAKFLNSRHRKGKEKTIDELSDKLFDINILTERLNNLFTILTSNYFGWADMENDKNRWFFINNYKQISALIHSMQDIVAEADRLISEVTDIDLKNIKA